MQNFDIEDSIKMPGYDLMVSYQAGIPVYKVRLKVKNRKKQTLKTLPEFVLKLIGLGINNQEDIEKTLGLQNIYVKNALENLSSFQLIKTESYLVDNDLKINFSVTGKGQEAIANVLSANYETLMDIIVDGITGEISSPKEQLFDAPDLKKQGIWLLHSSANVRPSVENLNDRLSIISPIYNSQQEEGEKSNQLLEVLDILRLWLSYKVIKILVFRNRQKGDLKLRAFKGFEALTLYDSKLTDRERTGGRVIPDHLLVNETELVSLDTFSELDINTQELAEQQDRIDILSKEKLELEEDISKNKLADKFIVTSRTKRIQELEYELKLLQEKFASTRTISGSEHFSILKQSFQESQQSIIIISPWIKKDVVDEEMIKLMKEALNRGVWIIIGYGMPLRNHEKQEDYIDEWVLGQFKQIKKVDNGKKLIIKWLGTHEKILISDRRFSIITSYNWLSYRGQKGFRREMGVYSEDPFVVADTINKIKSSLNLESLGLDIFY